MRKIVLPFIVFFCFILSAIASTPKVIPTLYQNVDKAKMNHWVDSVFNQLSMDERIGQLFIAVLHGNNTQENANAIQNQVRNVHLGGILFSKSTPQAHAELTNKAQAVAKVPLMVTLDGEWGLAMRLSNTTPFPKNMMLGAIQQDTLLYLYGQEVARQSKVMGIHVNFAPAMDVNSNPINPVIGFRSFGEKPKRVGQLGVAYSKGLESGGVMAVSKHFPGHGDTSTDSHFVLPKINHSKARLDSIELVPFKEYINEALSGIMIAHLEIPAYDSKKQPSSLSKNVVTDLLQTQLGFSGLIFTDGLQMKGVSQEDEHCVRALLAGNDVLLGPTYLTKEYNSVKDAVKKGTISESLINEKVKKVLSYKYILGVNENKSVDTKNLNQRLNTTYANWLNRQLHQKSITLLKDKGEILPLKKLDKEKIAVVAIGAKDNNRFATIMDKYTDVDRFSAADNAALQALKTKLDKYTTIVFSVHNTRVNANPAIASISKGKNSIITFFTVPYRMEAYKTAINESDAVISAYEDTELAQEFAAQAIFGGSEITGKLSVSVDGLFDAGTGITKKKTRLGYGMPEDVGIQSSALDSIRVIVEEGIREKAFPGSQVLIVKNGIVIYEEAFGAFEYNGQRKVTTTDIYDLASMTKGTSTVAAVMKLYDEDKLSLNDALGDYIPLLKGSNKSNISIRDALFHESRIPSFIPYYVGAVDENSYSGNLFNNRKVAPYTAMVDGGTYARTDYKFKPNTMSTQPKAGYKQMAEGMYINKAYTDSLIVRIANTKLRARKSYMYSCLNFMLLKETVEKQAGTDLNTYVQKNFFQRLGATTTTYNPLTKFSKTRIAPTEQDDFLGRGLVQGYVHDEGAAFMGGISGNAGLFSSANDLAKLYQMLLNGGTYGGERYLSEKTTTLFTSSKSSISRRGLGFDKPDPSSSKASPTSLSTPNSTYGHTGFTGTAFWIDPDNDLIYIFLSNRVYPNRTYKNISKLNIRSRIQEQIYNALKK